MSAGANPGAADPGAGNPGAGSLGVTNPEAARESATGGGGRGGGGVRGGSRASGRSAVAEEHLRNAEDAFRAGNHLRQIAEADLALHADPRSARAKYLVGDGLLKTGDLDRGCRYLRELKRNPGARERARAGGCPGD